jgi:hypothetical protein
MDKVRLPDRRKPPKQAQFPDTLGRASMYASKLVTGAGVSGSSPLVGSLFCRDFQVKRRARRDLGAKAEPNVLQRAERGTLG